MMWLFFYDLIVQSYFLSIRLVSPFNKKAKLWVKGRSNLLMRLENDLAEKRKPGQPLAWFHCASLGEFEQGRPVIEKIRKKHPQVFILLTFFSPSGYEIRKEYPNADYVAYLPPDSRKNAKVFIEVVNPALAVFVKYEFWFHILSQLDERKIPTILISAVFRKEHPFFKPWGILHRRMLSFFKQVLVQDKSSEILLNEIDITQVSVCGDPRVDRVVDIASERKEFPLVKSFCGGNKVLIAGSTWLADERCLELAVEKTVPNDWKVIIAPHDISERRLKEIESKPVFNSSVRYSKLESGSEFIDCDVLIIDNIGMLSSIYAYGHVAYVGGGFGSGIHNLLEPMAFGLPVIFGPKHGKFNEAKQAIRMGAGYSIKNKEEFLDVFLSLSKEAKHKKASKASQQYIAQNKGASEQISSILSQYLP